MSLHVGSGARGKSYTHRLHCGLHSELVEPILSCSRRTKLKWVCTIAPVYCAGGPPFVSMATNSSRRETLCLRVRTQSPSMCNSPSYSINYPFIVAQSGNAVMLP